MQLKTVSPLVSLDATVLWLFIKDESGQSPLRMDSDKLSGVHWMISLFLLGLFVSTSSINFSSGSEVRTTDLTSFEESVILLLILSLVLILRRVEVLLLKNIDNTSSAPSRTFCTVLRTSPSSIAQGTFCFHRPLVSRDVLGEQTGFSPRSSAWIVSLLAIIEEKISELSWS